MTEHVGLGRLPAPDSRDASYPLRAMVPTTTDRKYRYWYPNGWWGDQGRTSQCVAYSWTHWLEDGPITHKGPAPIVEPASVYNDAQVVDEWPGENYNGTSVRAGAKVLADRGLIGEYLWAWDLETVVRTILDVGPVVVGTNWYSDMFEPSQGIIKVSGYVAGGHAYLLNGVNRNKGMIRLKNSWGRDWGSRGHAYISFEDMDRLVKEDGEACLALEFPSNGSSNT